VKIHTEEQRGNSERQAGILLDVIIKDTGKQWDN
jgi:hypothetical protein